MAFAPLKLEPLTTPVRKSGKEKLITVNVISGHWDVSFIKWLLLGPLSQLMISPLSTKMFYPANILRLVKVIQKISGSLLECVLL